MQRVAAAAAAEALALEAGVRARVLSAPDGRPPRGSNQRKLIGGVEAVGNEEASYRYAQKGLCLLQCQGWQQAPRAVLLLVAPGTRTEGGRRQAPAEG